MPERLLLGARPVAEPQQCGTAASFGGRSPRPPLELRLSAGVLTLFRS